MRYGYLSVLALAKGRRDMGMTLLITSIFHMSGHYHHSRQQCRSCYGMALPQEMIDAVNSLGFFESIPVWVVSLIGSLFIIVLSFIMLMTVYGRF